MTDADRFRLDSELKNKYEMAVADLSRSRQELDRYGKLLSGVGRALSETPEKMQPWCHPEKGWLVPHTPDMVHLAEERLWEWQTAKDKTDALRELIQSVERLSREMSLRKLL